MAVEVMIKVLRQVLRQPLRAPASLRNPADRSPSASVESAGSICTFKPSGREGVPSSSTITPLRTSPLYVLAMKHLLLTIVPYRPGLGDGLVGIPDGFHLP